MSPAICVCNPGHQGFKLVVLLEAIRNQDPLVIPVECQRSLVPPSAKIFENNGGLLLVEFTRPMHPHVVFVACGTFLVSRVVWIIVMDDLYRRFIRLQYWFLELFFGQPAYKRRSPI